MTDTGNENLLALKLEKPHQKPYLTTPIGRFVERASYTDLLTLGILINTLSSIYFWLMPAKHSLNKNDLCLFDAAYFSIVTFTSLGYGDLTPQGFGRFIATTVVILGLVFIALLVGKFASERQQTILLLIHTSDCQRRISEFTSQIHQLVTTLEGLLREHQIDHYMHVKDSLKSSTDRLEAISNYLMFHSNQARLVEFGNENTLMALYKKISELQSTCIKVHKAEERDLLISKRSLALANRCKAIIKLMTLHHQQAVEQTSYLQTIQIIIISMFKKPQQKNQLSSRINRIYLKMELEATLLNQWSLGKVTPIILESVYHLAPFELVTNWPVGTHKEIARKLNISNSLSSRCLDNLIRSGKLPHTRPPKIQNK